MIVYRVFWKKTLEFAVENSLVVCMHYWFPKGGSMQGRAACDNNDATSGSFQTRRRRRGKQEKILHCDVIFYLSWLFCPNRDNKRIRGTARESFFSPPLEYKTSRVCDVHACDHAVFFNWPLLLAMQNTAAAPLLPWHISSALQNIPIDFSEQ